MDRNKIFTPNYIQVDGKPAKIIGDGDTILVLDSAGQIYHKNGESIAPLVAGGGGTVDLSWNNIKSKPQWIIDENAPNASKLGNVAASEYARKSDIPSIPATVTWSTLSGKPTWIGDSKPTYTWSEVSNKPSWIGDSKPSYTWPEIGNKPTTMSLTSLNVNTIAPNVNSDIMVTSTLRCTGDVIAYATDNSPMAMAATQSQVDECLYARIALLEERITMLEKNNAVR